MRVMGDWGYGPESDYRGSPAVNASVAQSVAPPGTE